MRVHSLTIQGTDWASVILHCSVCGEVKEYPTLTPPSVVTIADDARDHWGTPL